ncbi:class I SAM-dependent methyltransferase [Lachnospiraceae bacterium ZAX-1]
MIEKVGEVSLNYRHYPGEDFYSDGKVEDEILDIVKNNPEEDFTKIINERLDWAILYHLSKQRTNIISWYPFEEDAKILEIGSGCGAITGTLAEKGNKVVCIDLSKKRSEINAHRNKEKQNIEILVGNFQDIEQELERDFDYITLIGTFEYGQAYIEGIHPYHGMLRAILSHLKPGGKIFIAIENKYGLKYWAGCQEDHVGRFFENMEGYQNTDGARTFSRQELTKIIEECGCRDYYFYYPYPDYKFPKTIYSDAYLPHIGELNQNVCNFDRRRLVLFDEGKVYNQIIADELYPTFANSFLIEIRKEV